MILARLAVLLYIFVGALAGVDVEPVASTAEDRLSVAAAPAQDELQSADDDADDDDDDFVDGDCDDDCLPSTTPRLAAAAPASAPLTITADCAPASAARDSLFRPPRLSA